MSRNDAHGFDLASGLLSREETREQIYGGWGGGMSMPGDRRTGHQGHGGGGHPMGGGPGPGPGLMPGPGARGGGGGGGGGLGYGSLEELYAGLGPLSDVTGGAGPNRGNLNAGAGAGGFGGQPPFAFNHHHPNLPQPRASHPLPQNPFSADSATTAFRPGQPPPNSAASKSTLIWGDLEPWMDEEYAKQVCNLMGWDPVSIKVPHPQPDPATGQQANNPGYCFLTFPSPAHAASVLAQVNSNGSGGPVTMPNSPKAFVMNWAAGMPATSPVGNSFSAVNAGVQNQYPKEYSIFVGDLAPETSNSDLVAVFRNPVLGLRNDREPKFIRPFLSCKSAKIMLDPVTGVSRGYGFVRFTDEADQQRALIEMHGLYCLSRPMRISPATAKNKQPQGPPPPPGAQGPFDLHPPFSGMEQQPQQPVTVALPLPPPTKSVSAPMASATSSGSLKSTSTASSGSVGGSNSLDSLASTSTSVTSYGSGDMLNPSNVFAQLAQQYNAGDRSGNTTYGQQDPTRGITDSLQRFTISEESWKHHAQARAILGNLIGPNGEQLTSTDPYNTTVFVGGLSPLISEDTLRTFFAPFGDIHYVKVPVGKHCGFVQFVRKADAENAIEKMQGFPIGGSRIRLSWGRSQYKAAQAAAQAAQAAAVQGPQITPPPAAPAALPQSFGGMTQEQAIQLLQRFTMQGYLDQLGPESQPTASQYSEEKLRSAVLASRDDSDARVSTFSPFSPDPNSHAVDSKRRESLSYGRPEALPSPVKVFAPAYYPLGLGMQTQQEMKANATASSNSSTPTTKVSPTVTRPGSASRYPSFLDNTQMGTRIPVSRPSSGHRDGEGQEYDVLHDLNGTLASLELDRPWKSPAADGSESSSPSVVHFRPGASSPP